MAKTIPRKRIMKTERHIRWNWELSPENSNLARYHFIVVDDKNRDMIMNSLVEKISKAGIISVPINLIRTRNGKVGKSGLRYLFQSYDSKLRLEEFVGINKPIKRDRELKERIKKGISIEQYVEEIYSN